MRRSTSFPRLLLIGTVYCICICFSIGKAQSVANYGVVRNTGIAYNSIIASGTAPSSWRNGADVDDNRSFPVNIGFDFWYDGVRYTQFSISTNGYLDFSASSADGGPTAGPYDRQNTRFSSNNGTFLALAPMYDDLSGQGVNPLANNIKTFISGVAPNRILTTEWLNLGTSGNNTPSLNFQVKLHETTGQIEYVYGTMTSGTGSYSYTCGFNASSVSNSPTLAELKCQQAVNSATFNNGVQNNLTVVPATNSQFLFTPPVPLNASGSLTFSGVTPSQMTLNFPNWATNEVGYVIYSSTDNVNFTFATQTAVNATSATVTGLFSNTTYYWKVYAVTEGCLSSTSLNGTQGTLPGITFISITTGNWNTGSTWNTGTVPGPNDNVIIANSHTVTVNADAFCANLTINQGGAASVLQVGNGGQSRTLTINGNVTVGVNGTFKAKSNSNTTHQVNFYGSITNNGVVDFAPDANSFCNAAFLSTFSNQLLDGTGATNRYNLITVNKGSSNAAILEVSTSTFVPATGFLTLLNGTFKISTTAAINITPFSATADIPSTAKLWLNSATAIVNSTNGNINLFGELLVTNGTFNIGSVSNNCLMSNGGLFTMNGGTVNIAGRFDRLNAATLTRFTITNGTLILNTVGSTSATNAPFMMDVVGSQFSESGGTIIIRRMGTNNLGFNCSGGTVNTVTGGVLQIGDALSPAAQLIQINTISPIGGFRVASANATGMLITNPIVVINDVELQSGTFLANTLNVTLGGNWTNTGGTYIPGTNTTTFNGSTSTAINGSAVTQTFNNVVVAKTAGTTLSVGGSTTTTTMNNFTETTGNFTAGATLNVNTSAGSNVLLTSGTFTAGTTVNVTGNWTNNGATTVPGTSTTNFTGTLAQAINGTTASQNFYNVVLLKSVGTTLTVGGSTTTLTTNNLTETTGNFISCATLNVNASSSANVLLSAGTFTAGTTTNVTGNWTNNGGVFIPGTSTTNFTGTAAQAINGTAAAQTFYNVVVLKSAGTTLSTGGSTVTLTTNNLTETTGNFTAPATLNINASPSASLLVSSGNFTAGAIINITGNWTYDGGNIFPGVGVVNFTGTLAQVIGGLAVSQTFYNVVEAKSVGTTLSTGGSTTSLTTNNLTETTGNFLAPATLNINSTPSASLLLSAGTFTAGTVINIKGNWTNNGGTFLPGTNTVNFTGTLAQAINGTAAAQTFYNFFVLKLAGTTLSVTGSTTTLTVNNFTETNGNFTACATLNVNTSPTSFILLTSGTFTSGTTINLNGNWTDNGATCVPGASTINFLTAGTESIGGTVPIENFNNVVFLNGGINTIAYPINCGDVTINSGDTLVGGTPGYTIFTKGNWNNSGNFKPGINGTVVCNGATPQTIGGTSITNFRNITIQNNAGVNLIANENMYGTLTLTNGVFTTTGYNFKLKSIATGTTARIGQITGGNIVGNIMMERYIYNGPTQWRQMCAPVTGTTLQDWNDDVVTSGFPGSDFPAMTFISVESYDETVLGYRQNGYVPPTNVTTPLVAKKGYFVYVGPIPDLVVVTGPPVKMNQSFTLTYTPSPAGPTQDGWNMLGNPYPSSIDWDAAGWTRTNTDNVLYVWNPNLLQYAVYVSGVGVNGGSKNIPSSQAFWVRAIGANPVMSIVESVKTPVDQSYMHSAQIQTNNDLLSLSISGSAGSDQSIIRFDPSATDTFDVNLDAVKFASMDTTVPYLSSVTTNLQDLCVNTLQDFSSSVSVPLHVTVGVSGNYTFTRDSISDLPNSMCLVLEDLLSGITTQLTQNATYTCFISDTTNATRFILHFGSALTTGSVAATCGNAPNGKAWAKGTGIGPWDYVWKDGSGNVFATHNTVAQTDSVFGLIPGNYIVEVNGNDGYCTFRTDTIVVNGPVPIQTGATVTPLTCSYTSDGKIKLNIITGGAPPYALTWFDGSHADSLMNLTAGSYSLLIVDSTGCTDSTLFLVNTTSTVSASFTATPDTVMLQSLVSFANYSFSASSYVWDFGDSSPIISTTSPVHSYSTVGTYTVMLVADDGICFDTTAQTVFVFTTASISENNLDGNIGVVGGHENIGVLFHLPSFEHAQIKVYDAAGNLYADQEDYVGEGRVDIPMTGAASQVYSVQVILPEKEIIYSAKVVLIR
jgi:hypothetical protein